MLTENNCQPRILYPGKMYIKNKGKINIFIDKNKVSSSLADMIIGNNSRFLQLDGKRTLMGNQTHRKV